MLGRIPADPGEAMTDPYTMEARLCDDYGMIAGEYLKRFQRRRLFHGFDHYAGPELACTGHEHPGNGEHIRCTSPFHAPAPEAGVGFAGAIAARRGSKAITPWGEVETDPLEIARRLAPAIHDIAYYNKMNFRPIHQYMALTIVTEVGNVAIVLMSPEQAEALAVLQRKVF